MEEGRGGHYVYNSNMMAVVAAGWWWVGWWWWVVVIKISTAIPPRRAPVAIDDVTGRALNLLVKEGAMLHITPI